MRASEFTIEGPTDWMQQQVISRKQKDKAKVQKQNAPKIAKLIQQQLAAKVDLLLKSNTDRPGAKADKLSELVMAVLSTALKVNLDTDEFDNSMDLLKTQIEANPANIESNPQITSAIADIVNTSFNAAHKDKSSAGSGTVTAEVYDLPAEMGDRDMVYANDNGDWTLWQKTGRNRALLINEIDPADVPQIKLLIKSTKTEPSLVTFNQIQGQHYQTHVTAAE